MKRRYRWSQEAKALVEIIDEPRERITAAVFGDIPAYQSPVTGQCIDGRRQRREDLKRTGSRPYEGRETELQIARGHRESEDRKLDQIIEKRVVDAWQHSPERIRKLFK